MFQKFLSKKILISTYFLFSTCLVEGNPVIDMPPPVEPIQPHSSGPSELTPPPIPAPVQNQPLTAPPSDYSGEPDDYTYSPPTFKRTLSYDSAFWSSAPSNRSFMNLMTEYHYGMSALYDVLNSTIAPRKFMYRYIYENAFYFLTLPFMIFSDAMIHDFGHGSRMAAAGIQPEYWSLGDANNADENFKNHIDKGASFWALLWSPYSNMTKYSFRRGLSSLFSGAIARFDKEKLFPIENEDLYINNAEKQEKIDALKKLSAQNNTLTPQEKDLITSTKGFTKDWSIVITAGGYNNQMEASRKLADEIYFHTGAPLVHGWSHMRLKMYLPIAGISESLSLYEGDLSAVSSLYKNKNLSITQGDVALYSLISLLASGTTYATILADNWDYPVKGITSIKPLEWKGLRIPDLYMFMTSRGLSYQLTTGYRFFNNLFLFGGIEAVFKGDNTAEVSLGIYKKLPFLLDLSGEAEVVACTRGVSGRAGVGLSPFSGIRFSVGLSVYDVNTLWGERNISSLEKGKRDIEFWARIGVAY